VSSHETTKERILSGKANANIDFDDLVSLVLRLGFALRRQNGSHRIFARKDFPGILSLQPGRDGKAKPYQVKQVADAIRLLNL
jgi:predicted RNA binding protein YcfA (HicA-like mRNA interferase family)